MEAARGGKDFAAMSELEVEPILDELRKAEALVLQVVVDERRRESWRAAGDCLLNISLAMQAAADMARNG